MVTLCDLLVNGDWWIVGIIILLMLDYFDMMPSLGVADEPSMPFRK